MNLEIRAFEPRDQAAAKALIEAGLRERFDPYHADWNPDLEDIGASFDAFLVAVLGGEVVGTGGLIFETGSAARVKRMSTARHARGRGVARAVLARLLEIAVDRGATRARLETNTGWAEAVRLYTRAGFRVLGEFEDEYGYRGTAFERPLDP